MNNVDGTILATELIVYGVMGPAMQLVSTIILCSSTFSSHYAIGINCHVMERGLWVVPERGGGGGGKTLPIKIVNRVRKMYTIPLSFTTPLTH